MTVFGPGVGECIVLHLGNREWMVIDSCILPGDEHPIAIRYLQAIGVDHVASVKSILATHWHDDHIRGMAYLVRECRNAKFSMSAALNNKEFLRYLFEVREAQKLVTHTSSAHEFVDILDELQTRSSAKYPTGPHTLAQAKTQLLSGGYNGATSVWALSPSSATVFNSQMSIASQLAGKLNRRFKPLSCNDLSVAVLVNTSKYSLLLGADLEHGKDYNFGWKAVLHNNTDSGQSHAYKVAHHGSSNADHDDIWNRMIVEDPIAVVTPFAKLNPSLPRTEDISRMKRYCSKLYCTAWPLTKKPPKRPGVDRFVDDATRSRKSLNQKWGFVRLRINLEADSARAEIDLAGNAAAI